MIKISRRSIAKKAEKEKEKNMCKFRNLKADEIDVRVSQVKEKWFTLLLYKDARCDMNILDETVGSFNWKREHSRDNANCTVSLWDKEKQQWISKEDTGTESNTEKEKGLASDSFKRACFNWGIGRELYTSPFIFCPLQQYIKKKGESWTVSERFKVKSIEISEDKIITALTIEDSKGNIVFSTNNKTPNKENEDATTLELINKIKELGIKEEDVCAYYKVGSMTEMAVKELEKIIQSKMKKLQKQGK